MKKILIFSILTIGMLGCKARTHNDSKTEGVETTVNFSKFPVSDCLASGSLIFRATISLVSQEAPIVKNVKSRYRADAPVKDIPLKGVYLVNVRTKGIPPLTKSVGITTQTFTEDDVNILAGFSVNSNGSVDMMQVSAGHSLEEFQRDGKDIHRLENIDVWVDGKSYTVNNSPFRFEDTVYRLNISPKGFWSEHRFFKSSVSSTPCPK